MAEQPSLFDVGELTKNPHTFEPVPAALEGARQFTRGRHTITGLDTVHADRFRAHGIARAYQDAEVQPESPTIGRSYDSFRRSVNKQYDYMTRPKEQGGMGIRHEIASTGEPYDPNDPHGVQRMASDVASGVIRTLPTDETGSGERQHAALTNEENDRFRAVHDVFGHAASGRGFDEHGEEAAFLSHKQMFPKSALEALTSETRGQNAVLNRGRGGFVDQSKKLIGLPRGASRTRWKPPKLT